MKILQLLFLSIIPISLFAQLDDQALSFSYRFGFGKIAGTNLETDMANIPHAYIGGKKWCRSNEFDMTWHMIPNVAATIQVGGSAYVIDQEAFEQNITSQFSQGLINTMMPKAYKTMDVSLGPTGFWMQDAIYVQAGALFGMQIQRRNHYDAYLYGNDGYPTHTYQYLARGPLGWVAEGNLRAGIMTDSDMRFGFFIGGNYRYAFNRIKITETHFNAVERNASKHEETFSMDIQSWQIQLGVQLLFGG